MKGQRVIGKREALATWADLAPMLAALPTWRTLLPTMVTQSPLREPRRACV